MSSAVLERDADFRVRLLSKLEERGAVPSRHLSDPEGWANDRLGEVFWSKQQEVATSVVKNRYTAVHSAHSTGKSYLASRLASWWLDVHPLGEAFVVTTAPTAPQVKAILWREIKRAHRKGGLGGHITDAEIPEWKIEGELVAYGRKPADYTDPSLAASAFQGIHARFVFVILDEAGGIPEWLWDAVDTLASNENARVLAIGNPDNPASHFAKVCKPGSGWNRIHISAFHTPAFTGEAVPASLLELLTSRTWVEERKKRWGEGSMLYTSKVLGVFPEVSEDTLIPPSLWEKAAARALPGLKDPGRYGVDVARTGSDESAIYLWRGGNVRVEWSGHTQDTMTLAGKVYNLIEPHKGRIPAIIDVIGIGAGVFDRTREQGLNVVPFNASERALDPVRFKNKRAEQYWTLRQLFTDEAIDVDPKDEDLAAQVTAIKFGIDSSGRIQIESKDDMKKRGLPSPDRADAVMMSSLAPPAWADYSPPPSLGLTGDLLKRGF